MSEKKRILIIENSTDLTGAFKSIMGFVKLLRADFDFFFAIKTKSKLSDPLAIGGISYCELPFLEINKSWKTVFYLPILFINAWRTLRFIKKHGIQTVHVNDLYNMVGVLVKMLNPEIKLIYHIRLLPDSYVQKFYFSWLRVINWKADQVIVVSEIVRQSVSTHVSKPTQLIYDFVPLTEIYHNPQKSTGTFKFVYPANYSLGKGQDLALIAFADLYKTFKNATLTFFGSDSGSPKNEIFKKQLIQNSEATGLSKAVSFESSSNNIEKLMKDADAVLMFSESESFSLICYEALFYGAPIIATNCGGPAEIIEHRKTGLLVANRDTRAMAEAMMEIVSNPMLREFISKTAPIKIREKMEIHNSVYRLHEIYK